MVGAIGPLFSTATTLSTTRGDNNKHFEVCNALMGLLYEHIWLHGIRESYIYARQPQRHRKQHETQNTKYEIDNEFLQSLNNQIYECDQFTALETT